MTKVNRAICVTVGREAVRQRAARVDAASQTLTEELVGDAWPRVRRLSVPLPLDHG
ncbi:MAG: hypothetical protein M9894_31815 [Planctomycetes bacterium]|nr:hypothetical protein [Planctomycetota bacterium]